MGVVLAPELFTGRDAVFWAPWLLGKTLVRTHADGSASRHLIVETEAYNSADDLACHASKGRTPRTDVLFRQGGVWYVYLCYGVHEMLNLVVGPEGFPAAVLFRGLHDVSGPGRLTRRLGIGRLLNGRLAAPAEGLHLEDEGLDVTKKWIRSSPRIGVDYAGPIWARKPWRFLLAPGWPGFSTLAAPPAHPRR